MQVTCKRKLFSYFFFFFFLIVLKPRLSIHNGQLETRQISKFHREFRGAGTGKGVGHFVKRGGTKLRLVLSFFYLNAWLKGRALVFYLLVRQ